jgi:hypothetical protein
MATSPGFRKAFIIVKEVDELIGDCVKESVPREANRGETDIKSVQFEREVLKQPWYNSILKIIRKYKKILSNIGEKNGVVSA